MYISGQIIVFHQHPSSRALGPAAGTTQCTLSWVDFVKFRFLLTTKKKLIVQFCFPNMRPQIQTRKSPMTMKVSFHCLCNFPLLRKRWPKFETTSLICAHNDLCCLTGQLMDASSADFGDKVPTTVRGGWGPQAKGRCHTLGVPEAEWAPSPSRSGVRNHLRSYPQRPTCCWCFLVDVSFDRKDAWVFWTVWAQYRAHKTAWSGVPNHYQIHSGSGAGCT